MRRTSARAFSQLVVLVVLVCGIATLFFARAILVPFALALLFAFLLTPVVRLLDRIHVPRAASSVGLVAVTVIALAFVGWVVTGQVLDVANQLPSYRLNIKKKIESLRGQRNQDIHKAANAVNEIGKELVTEESAPSVSAKPDNLGRTSTPAGSPGKPLPVEVIPPVTNPLESLNSLIGPISTFCIVAVFTVFMLIRREDLRNRFIRLIGHQHLNTLTQALDDASSRVSRYLLLQLAVNAGYGLIVATGLYFIGIPHVLLWGVLAALLRFVPYVGSLLSSVLPIMLSLAMFDGWTRPLLTLLLYAVAELVIGNVVEPLLYAAHVGLSSLAILVAAVFWTVLWGPIGLVLSTPLTVCLVVIGQYVPDLGFLNVVLGDEPVLSPESHFYQRLLASDQHEAKLVLEECLKDNNLTQVYDTVLIPALALAEQDRHRNDLDETTQQFISVSTKELIEELYEKSNELPPQSSQGTDDKSLGGGVPSQMQFLLVYHTPSPVYPLGTTPTRLLAQCFPNSWSKSVIVLKAFPSEPSLR